MNKLNENNANENIDTLERINKTINRAIDTTNLVAEKVEKLIDKNLTIKEQETENIKIMNQNIHENEKISKQNAHDLKNKELELRKSESNKKFIFGGAIIAIATALIFFDKEIQGTSVLIGAVATAVLTSGNKINQLFNKDKND